MPVSVSVSTKYSFAHVKAALLLVHLFVNLIKLLAEGPVRLLGYLFKQIASLEQE